MEKRGRSGAVIQLTGNRSAVVEGCDGIVDYDDVQVVLRTGRLTVRFAGQSLRLKRLTADTAVIEGFLAGVEYLQ